MKLPDRWQFAIVGFVFGVLAATGYFYLQGLMRDLREPNQEVTRTVFRIFHDRSLATLKQHRVLAGDLAAGAINGFPNANATPLIGFAKRGATGFQKWEDVLEPGEGLVFVKDSHSDIENATDSETAAKMVLYLPAPPDPAGQTFRFENGYSPEGALLFVTDMSFAWGWPKIGYPVQGVVSVSRDATGVYWVNISADFRYARYGDFNVGDGEDIAGWRDGGTNSTTFYMNTMRFPE